MWLEDALSEPDIEKSVGKGLRPYECIDLFRSSIGDPPKTVLIITRIYHVQSSAL